jgi:hypothetical protein
LFLRWDEARRGDDSWRSKSPSADMTGRTGRDGL